MKLRQFTLRTLFAAVLFLSLPVGLVCLYGESFYWRFKQTFNPTFRRKLDVEPKLNSLPIDGQPWSVGGLSFVLPAKLSGAPTVRSLSGRTLFFRDGESIAHFSVSSNAVHRRLLGAVPKRLAKKSSVELWHRLYSYDSSDNTWLMSHETIEEFDWIVNFRKFLSYEPFTEMYLLDKENLSAIVLTSAGKNRRKAAIMWFAKNSDIAGTVHMYDSEGSDDDWCDQVAQSLDVAVDAEAFTIWDQGTDQELLDSVQQTKN